MEGCMEGVNLHLGQRLAFRYFDLSYLANFGSNAKINIYTDIREVFLQTFCGIPVEGYVSYPWQLAQ